ncbi:hypothetical protein J057_16745 [Marinobacter nanhaiticus D15-8W]|uniref:Hydrazine synthase alpha subunit middle domain-containing protein n=2 Tax=Marinobacter TaxID=2742 RepID=N6VSB6_9GAMM|nr:hypothetical protein J057_16745 [Marinobacter nanhaiticus D15-8W]
MSPKLGLVVVVSLTLVTAGCRSSGGSDQEADPVVVENAVAFIKRPLAFDNDTLMGDDRRDPEAFRPGARLYVKDRASPSARSRDITSAVFSDPSFLNDEGDLLYDVRGLDVSYDGSKLLFAMRAPEIEDADDDEQPTWNIWEYDTTSGDLHRIIESDTIAEAGQDVAPAYLPDDRIVFSSTRQRISKAILLDEGKPQFDALDEDRDSPAFVLHVMESDGSEIEQITFNQSHDLDPTVMGSGKIVFSRWDNAGQTRNNGVNLYQVNPDGTGLSLLYGRHSHGSVGDEQVQYYRAVETEPDRLLVQVRPFESENLTALPMDIDVGTYVEANQQLDGMEGEGQVPVIDGYDALAEVGLEGSYGAASPLFDGTNRYLVSWSPCRLVMAEAAEDDRITNCTQERLDSGEYETADPVFGLWLLDQTTGTQLPIERPVEGQQIDEAVLMTRRPVPTYIPPATLFDEAETLAENGYGVVHIQSVYDLDGRDQAPGGIRTVADPARTDPTDRPAMFVRFEKPVSIPDDDVRDLDNAAFGRSAAQSMREILGYAPVEPDGSVRVAVPANVAFAISVLDANGQRTSARHQNWLQLRPGETLECQGCHNPNSDAPHGRPGAGPGAAYYGSLTGGIPFPNTETALVAALGETMAETWSRTYGVRELQPDAVFEDDWTNPAVVPKATSFSFAYADLQTPSPISPACAAEWSSLCRVVINYEQHIHPLWGLDRTITDGVGTVIDDYTCTSCHSDKDAMDAIQVPAAQLDLTDGPSPDNPAHFKSYRELLFNDNEVEVQGGALIDLLVDTGEFQRDEDGQLILDGDGNPIPIFTTVPVPAPMSTAGARNSNRFMSQFRTGGAHEGFLSAAELKLISEWLDLGAQYYNNPFDAPED